MTGHDTFLLTESLASWAMAILDDLRMENTTIVLLTRCGSVPIWIRIAKQFELTYVLLLDTQAVAPELLRHLTWTLTLIGKLSCVVSFDTTLRANPTIATCENTVLWHCLRTGQAMEWCWGILMHSTVSSS